VGVRWGWGWRGVVAVCSVWRGRVAWADFNEGDYAIVWRKWRGYPRGWDFGDFFSWGNGGKVRFFEFFDGSKWGRASEGFYGVLGLDFQR